MVPFQCNRLAHDYATFPFRGWADCYTNTIDIVIKHSWTLRTCFDNLFYCFSSRMIDFIQQHSAALCIGLRGHFVHSCTPYSVHHVIRPSTFSGCYRLLCGRSTPPQSVLPYTSVCPFVPSPIFSKWEKL